MQGIIELEDFTQEDLTVTISYKFETTIADELPTWEIIEINGNRAFPVETCEIYTHMKPSDFQRVYDACEAQYA